MGNFDRIMYLPFVIVAIKKGAPNAYTYKWHSTEWSVKTDGQDAFVRLLDMLEIPV